MTIRASLPSVKNNLYFDEDFKKVLEDHLSLILNNFCEVAGISNATSATWRSDFYGLLRELAPQYPETLFWLTMRLNGLMSPTEWSGSRTSVIIVAEPTLIDQHIASNYNSK